MVKVADISYMTNEIDLYDKVLYSVYSLKGVFIQFNRKWTKLLYAIKRMKGM